MRLRLKKKIGIVDMNILGLRFGVDVVVYGLGDFRLDYIFYECISFSEYFLVIDVLVDVIEEFKGVKERVVEESGEREVGKVFLG